VKHFKHNTAYLITFHLLTREDQHIFLRLCANSFQAPNLRCQRLTGLA